MSRISDGMQLLLAASGGLDEISAAIGPNSDPEELGMLAAAKQLEEEAEGYLRAAAMAATPEEAAHLAALAEALFHQAAALRLQCKERLEERSAVAGATADAVKEVQGQLSEAVEGTNHGGDLIRRAAGIAAAIDEVRDSLIAAASMVTEREQTDTCLGLILQAQDQSQTAQQLCAQLQGEIEQYIGRL